MSIQKLFVATAAVLALAACQKTSTPAPTPAAQGVTEIAWARVALERNPHLEVVATDTDTGVFTVRDKINGTVRTIKLSEIAAVPVQELQAPRTASASAPQPESPALATTDKPATDAATDEPAVAQSSEASSDVEQSSDVTDPRLAAQGPGYTIERSDGGVKVSGPGVSIVSSGTNATATSRSENQRTSDPIVCEGRRMMHLDGRTIYADGDAIVARAGCELHITNSQIIATGTGLLVQGASVHVNNSNIQGATAAFDADGSAKMFVRGSTFNGPQRKHPYAMIQDLGGNQFRQASAGNGAE